MSTRKVHKTSKERRKLRVRKAMTGTPAIPRLSVFRSNKGIYVQAIDDLGRNTLAAASSKSLSEAKRTKVEQGLEVGKMLAEKLKKLGVMSGIFDRGEYHYHGRVKNVADGLRESGIKI